MRRFNPRIDAIRIHLSDVDCVDPAIGYPAALKRFATSGQLTTFHQASM
jgi:hypothetical protein